MKTEQLHDLCEAALECALNRELRDEWLEYLEQTRRHEQIVTKLLEELGLEEEEPAGRKVVAVDRLFSNPYVDWSERARDRDEMLRLLAQWTDGDEPRFSSLAVKYRVRYVAVPTDLVAPGFASTQRPLVWRSGVWSIYQIGA